MPHRSASEDSRETLAGAVSAAASGVLGARQHASPSRSLLVTRDYFPPQVGGIATMMWEICEGLGPERVSCLVGNVPGASGDSVLPPSSVRVYRSDLPFSRRLPTKFASLLATWPRVLIPSRINVLQFATCDDAYWGTYFHRMTGLKFAVYAHGNEVLSAAANSWRGARRALRTADAVFANSRYTAGLLTDRIGTRRERVHIVHPGCDPEAFSPGEPDASLHAEWPILSGADPVLLTVGNLVERKGQDLVLQCLPELRKTWPKLVYVIAGAGPNRAPLEKIARTLGVSESVCFAGRPGPQALRNLYRRCDVMVMPSRLRQEQHDVEGFGIVFLEANACGKPVIGGRSGGMADAIVHGETGFAVDSADAGDLTRHLQLLLADRQLAARLGANGRRRVVAELSWTAVARRVADITDDLVANRRASTRA
jgi:phosphatidylinositol alpha-1,6-mannosyltransferase